MSNQHANLPSKIYAEAVLRSASGESLLRSSLPITSKNISLFHSAPDLRQIAQDRLKAVGFDVLDAGNTSLNIVASPEVYEQVLGARLELIERPVIKESGQRDMAAFMNSADDSPLGEIDISQTDWTDILDGVALNDPAYYLQQNTTSAFPPETDTRYLQVPDELATELSATLAHKEGITGKGVKVVVVDSGCYAEHEFFKYHKYNLDVELGPGSANKDEDLNGHGTGVAANVFAVAPDVNLTVLKADVALGNKKYKNINSTAAFRRAVALKPDIISCSWGSDLRNPYQLSSSHKVLASVIADAVRQGIVVIFAAGNGQWGFPAQHPDVIAVGGVYKHLEGSLKGRVEASNYASSFISSIYADRRVPDVCGLVGQLPHAAYIMLPVPPGSGTDRGRSLIGDGTEPNDGWSAFSGTSAAAPQLAGACALLEQFVPGLAPKKIREILRETASDVIDGNSHPSTGGGQARAGPDLATGYGLAVAHKAVQAAKKAYAQKQKQLPVSYSTDFSAETDSNSNTQPEQLQLEYFAEKNITRSLKEMPLDDSTLRKLRREIDEIEIELNQYLQKTIFERIGLKNIELVIHEGNFIEETSELTLISSLRDIVREVVTNNGSIDSDSIRKKHVSAAESLLKKNKCQELAKALLVKAMDLGGKKLIYSVTLDNEEESTFLDSINTSQSKKEKITLELLPKEFEKLNTEKIANSSGFYTIKQNANTFKNGQYPKADDPFLAKIFVNGGQGEVTAVCEGTPEKITSIAIKQDRRIFNPKIEKERDFLDTLLKGHVFSEEIVDRDEISESAAKALGNFRGASQTKDNEDNYFACSGDCWNGKQICTDRNGNSIIRDC